MATTFNKSAVQFVVAAAIFGSSLLAVFNLVRGVLPLFWILLAAIVLFALDLVYLRYAEHTRTAASAALIVAFLVFLVGAHETGLQAYFWIQVFPLGAYAMLGLAGGTIASGLLLAAFTATLALWPVEDGGFNIVEFDILASYVVVAILAGIYENARSRHAGGLEDLGFRDPLTRAFNRRKLDEVLDAETERAQRYHFPLSVLMLDLDHFKRINDLHGHKAGDRVLSKFAELIQQNTRSSDSLFRYGGEEFVVVAPQTGLDQAYALAEKIRATLENHRFPGVEPVTVSGGVARLRDGETPGDLVRRSDEAMYQAKAQGRNRVISIK